MLPRCTIWHLLYEGVANGTLLDPSLRSTFYDHMAGKGQFSHEGYDWTGLWSTDLPAIIDQEAPAGMSAAVKASFLAHMNLAYKAGNYKICTNGLLHLLQGSYFYLRVGKHTQLQRAAPAICVWRVYLQRDQRHELHERVQPDQGRAAARSDPGWPGELDLRVPGFYPTDTALNRRFHPKYGEASGK